MPLQNRVDPFGEIHAVPARGMFTGNRGIIHDPDDQDAAQKALDDQGLAHLRLRLQGRRREPMGRNAPNGRAGWTELFFLDEVTALAAGHRPCFYLPARAGEGVRGMLRRGVRHRRPRRRRSTHGCTANGGRRAASPQLDSRADACDSCPTARWSCRRPALRHSRRHGCCPGFAGYGAALAVDLASSTATRAC